MLSRCNILRAEATIDEISVRKAESRTQKIAGEQPDVVKLQPLESRGDDWWIFGTQGWDQKPKMLSWCHRCSITQLAYEISRLSIKVREQTSGEEQALGSTGQLMSFSIGVGYLTYKFESRTLFVKMTWSPAILWKKASTGGEEQALILVSSLMEHLGWEQNPVWQDDSRSMMHDGNSVKSPLHPQDDYVGFWSRKHYVLVWYWNMRVRGKFNFLLGSGLSFLFQNVWHGVHRKHNPLLG